MATTKAIEKLRDKLKAKEASMKNIRAKAREASERTVESAATVAGGAFGGYVHAEYGDKEYFGIEAQTAAGALLAVVGILDLAGKQSSIVGALGEGMLAYDMGRRVAEKRGTSSAGLYGRMADAAR